MRQIELRLSKSSAELAGRSAPQFAASVSVKGGAVEGRLVVTEPDGARSVRRVPGRSCSEVVAAMALITALTLDPNASTAPLSAAQRRAPPPAAPPGPQRRPPPERAGEHPHRTARWRPGVGMHAGLATAVAPSAVLALEPFVALRDAAPRIFAPEFRVSALRSSKTTVTTRLGQATLVWTGARLSACPLRWPARGGFELRPCALVDVGVLSGSGSKTHDPKSAHALWIAPGVVARLSYRPFAALSLELEGGATFPLKRDTFFFAPPETTAFHVPAAGAVTAIGLAAWLP